MRYCVQPATAKDVALLALAMGDEDAGDTEYDGDGEPKNKQGRKEHQNAA